MNKDISHGRESYDIEKFVLKKSIQLNRILQFWFGCFIAKYVTLKQKKSIIKHLK